MPLDTDNDLIVINDSITPAVGQITHLTGHVLTLDGPAGPKRDRRNLAGGQQRRPTSHRGATAHRPRRELPGLRPVPDRSKGQYYFRTIKPISYTLIGIFRTPHIHVAVSRNGKRLFTTQLLMSGHPDNARDSVVRTIDPAALDTLLVSFTPVPGSKIGEFQANFDVVLGKTLEELEDGSLAAGVAISETQRRRR